MAVAVSNISPADNATGINANFPVTFDLTDSTDMTMSLVEAVVNGISCTVANGLLDHWSIKTVSGGVYVSDLTSVTFGTLCHWYEAHLADITVVIKYNSSTLSTTSFTVAEDALAMSGGHPSIFFVEGLPPAPAIGLGAYYLVRSDGADWSKSHASFTIKPPMDTHGGVYFFVGKPFRTAVPASLVVGEQVRTAIPASLVVRGLARIKIPASIVVQGPIREKIPLSVIVGEEVRTVLPASLVVGEAVVTKIPSSLVVYETDKGMVVEVDVMDPDTATLLASLGVTFE